MSLVDIVPLATFIKVPEILLALLTFLLILKVIQGGRIGWRSVLFVLLCFIPFVLALGKNTLHFSPIYVWEINPELRSVWYDKLAMRNDITVANFSQLLYISAGIVTAFVFLNIKLQREQTVRAIKYGLLLVSFVGVIQLITFYSDQYEIYLEVFYNNITANYHRLPYQQLFGVKRVNSTLGEPSIFSLYLVLSYLMLYLLQDHDIRALIRSKSVIFSFFIGLMSTSGTFYLGVGLLSLFFIWYGKRYRWPLLLCLAIGISIALFLIEAYGLPSILTYIIEQKRDSFTERFFFGVLLPIENISKSPLFGFSFGSDRPTTLLFNLIISLGFAGFTIFLCSFALLRSRKLFTFLSYYIILGLLSPDLHYLFVWAYIGILGSATTSITMPRRFKDIDLPNATDKSLEVRSDYSVPMMEQNFVRG